MTFRPITLRKTDDTITEFYPEDIQEIIFKKDTVILQYWDTPIDKSTTKIILKKEDYYYPHWRYFINQLIRIFDIKEL